MSFFKKLLPQTFTNQVLLAVALALIIAQLVNLFILVDANRFQVRGNIFTNGMTTLVREIRLAQQGTGLHKQKPDDQDGIFLISNYSQAASLRSAKIMEDYQERLAQHLKIQGVEHLSSEVVLGKSTNFKPNHKNRSVRKGKGPSQNLISRCEPEMAQTDPYADLMGRPPPPQKHRPPPPSPDREEKPEVLIISVELCEGVWANLVLAHRSVEALTPKILLSTGFLLGLTLLAVWLFVRRISRPLSELTVTAERFGRGEQPNALLETGPADIKQATKAFNEMQRRLNRMVDTQRTMLRAVSHDLRTQLTSLRIRSEMIPEELNRDKFISTIDEMTLMTEEILAWAKNLSVLEELASVDLGALIDSVAADFQDQGANVSVIDFDPLIIQTRRLAIKRALVNVVSNALNYAGSAMISVEETANSINIYIDDNGPGIPETELENVLKPFVRLEPSRNRSTGGSGLGLSITAIILHTEGGNLSLHNREQGGLRVTMHLPI